MTRALTEPIIDPFECIYQLFVNKENYIKNIQLNYILIFIYLLITSSFSFVYNDFIVLYCCVLEYDTHLEINKRAISYENLNNGLMDDDNDNVDKESNRQRRADLHSWRL